MDKKLLRHLHDILVPFRLLAQEMTQKQAQSVEPSHSLVPRHAINSEVGGSFTSESIALEGPAVAYAQAMDLVEQYLSVGESPVEFCQWEEVWGKAQNLLQLAYPQANKRLTCRANSWQLMPLQGRYLLRILLNLLTNGIESMGKTGACEVVCQDLSPGLGHPHGAVFIQIKNDIGQKGGKTSGYGLGLEIVRDLVSNAGGQLRIYSQASRFVVEIELPVFSHSKMPQLQARA